MRAFNLQGDEGQESAMDLQSKINSLVSMQAETIEMRPERKYSAQEVLDLLKLQREAERERCAKIADKERSRCGDCYYCQVNHAMSIAAEIRGELGAGSDNGYSCKQVQIADERERCAKIAHDAVTKMIGVETGCSISTIATATQVSLWIAAKIRSGENPI